MEKEEYEGLEIIGEVNTGSINVKQALYGNGIPELSMYWKPGGKVKMGRRAAKHLDKKRYSTNRRVRLYARCRVDFFTVIDDE